jgi:hypothetical protein
MKRSSNAAGTLLGAGGPTGIGGALQAFIQEPGDRQKLFAAAAYDCETNQQLEEARELFMAADKPLMALGIIVQQLSQAIARGTGKQELCGKMQQGVEAGMVGSLEAARIVARLWDCNICQVEEGIG